MSAVLQEGFGFKPTAAHSRLADDELIVDLFAGGGGASTGLETALGRQVDVAINHNPDAVALHARNHPTTQHYCEDVWDVDPLKAVPEGRVGWLHASPDCTHHSQARGGQPRDQETRSLSWVVHKWAGKLSKLGRGPRIISLENVEQILHWSPLVCKRDKATGRCLTKDGRVASPGERIPRHQQFLVPDTTRKGHSWTHFVDGLRRMGYAVQWKKLKACDFGAGTSRERLFLIARLDGEPIAWPTPTHGKGRIPYVSAADCIDWSIPGTSIFGRKRPLKPNTERRIAKGLDKYVLKAAHPFIVPITHASSMGVRSADDPLRTITTAKGGEFMVANPVLMGVGGRAGQSEPRPASEPGYTTTGKADVAVIAPVLAQVAYGEGVGSTARRGDGCRSIAETVPTITGSNTHALTAATLIQAGYGEREGQTPRALDMEAPLGTVVAGGIKHAVAAAHLTKFRFDSAGADLHDPLPTITAGGAMKRDAGAAHALGVTVAFMEQANTGRIGHDARAPVSTVTTSGTQQRLVAAHLATLRGTNVGSAAADPLRTVTAGGEHHAVVEYTLSPEAEEGALRVAAFLMQYYGEGGGQIGDLRNPAATITTKQRLALVTVWLQGTPYVIVDITLRMLTPPELFRAQGFPADYVLDRGADGRKLTKTAQVKLVGNSVSPPPMAALAAANVAIA